MDNILDEFADEVCPACDQEQLIYSVGCTKCCYCGEIIIPCSVCDVDFCSNCPYDKGFHPVKIVTEEQRDSFR